MKYRNGFAVYKSKYECIRKETLYIKKYKRMYPPRDIGSGSKVLCSRILTRVLILDSSSEIGAHERSNLCCFELAFGQIECGHKCDFFHLFSFRRGTTCAVLPSNI